jgi:predicted Zn-dependent protease with MMP-like domain
MTWKELCRVADETIERCRSRLPPELRPHAARLPVTFEPFPQGAMLDDENVEPDILGLFVGSDLAAAASASDSVPPQILLFLENLWDHADGNLPSYREEVRITYLHELGHYLGWDEGEIERRGLG